MRRLLVLVFLRVFKIWDVPAFGNLVFHWAARSIHTHCASRIYSPAMKNQLPVSKLLSAACGCGSPTTELSFGVRQLRRRDWVNIVAGGSSGFGARGRRIFDRLSGGRMPRLARDFRRNRCASSAS